MLIVSGYFEMAPEDREAFIQARQAPMVRSRGEDGCHAYVFAPDPIEPGRVYLYERWESKEALAAHLAANRAAGRPADGVTVTSSEVKQYEIAEAGPLGS